MSDVMFRAIPLAKGTIGNPLLLWAPSWTVLTFFLAGCVTAGMVFAGTASYARKESVQGYLSPGTGVVRIQSPRSGTLATLAVANGDQVEVGRELFTVDASTALADGRMLDTVLADALLQQVNMLRDQRNAEQERAKGEAAELAAQIAGGEAELSSLRVQRQLLAKRVDLAGQRFKALDALHRKHYLAEADYRAREEDWLSQRQSLAAHDQRISAQEHALDQLRARPERLTAETADRLARIDAALADLSRRQVEAVAQAVQAVRAPVSGRVTALQAALGQRVDGSRPVLTVIPNDVALKAELFVPSRAIGFIRAGQRVRLMFDAFPFERFGTYEGTVASVSETVFAPDEVLGTVRPQEPSYRVSVRLDRQTVDAFGREVALQPDMTVRADIILEQRSLLQWLLEPLLSLRGRM